MTIESLKNLPKGAVITAGQFNPMVEELCVKAGFIAIGQSNYGKKYEKQF